MLVAGNRSKRAFNSRQLAKCPEKNCFTAFDWHFDWAAFGPASHHECACSTVAEYRLAADHGACDAAADWSAPGSVAQTPWNGFCRDRRWLGHGIGQRGGHGGRNFHAVFSRLGHNHARNGHLIFATQQRPQRGKLFFI